MPWHRGQTQDNSVSKEQPQNLKESNQYLTILIRQNSDFKDTKTDLLYHVHPGKKKSPTE